MLQARWQRDEGHCVIAGILIDEDLQKGNGVLERIYTLGEYRHAMNVGSKSVTGFYSTLGVLPVLSANTTNVRLLNWA